MHPRLRLICFWAVSAWLWLPAKQAVAQDLQNFPYTDSLTLALFQQGRWRALDSVGRAAVRVGTDYPVLRLRLGYAAARRDQPATAIRHYGRALRANAADPDARYGLVLAQLAMGQRDLAAFQARHLNDSLRYLLHLRGFYPVQRVELEATGQTTNSVTRGNAGVLRVGIGSQLRPWLYLAQSGSYFGQTVMLPETQLDKLFVIRQWEYHALLTAQFGHGWQVRASYHFLDSRFGATAYPGHLFYGALAYAQPFFTVQGGFYGGTLTDTVRTQADLRLAVYPLGNQRLYAFNRLSVVRSGGKQYPNGLLGFGSRVRRWCWLEVYGVTGQVPVLAEADGTYVYNLLDPLRRRLGVSTYLGVTKHLTARLHYSAEERRRAQTTLTYRLFALTTALQWTW